MATIWNLKRAPWTDEWRYYPPGAHPATALWRAQLARIQTVRSDLRLHQMDTTAADEAIAYIEGQLVSFEQAESEARAREHFQMASR